MAPAIEFIEEMKPEYVFPTAPFHIVAEMAKIKFKLALWKEAVNTILPRLSHQVILRSGKGNIIVSFNRDNECMDNCYMPETCPTSRVKRPCTMTSLMQYACPNAFILVSYSMAPGMGALKGSEINAFLNWMHTKNKFVVGTACDCHSVFSTFKKIETE